MMNWTHTYKGEEGEHEDGDNDDMKLEQSGGRSRLVQGLLPAQIVPL